MGIFSDLLGTLRSSFKIGITGVRLKNSTGNLVVRNSGDSADAEVTASKLSVSGEVIDLNSDAAGSGADWKYTLQRPTSGMSAAVVLTLPVDDGTPNQALVTDGNGVLSFADAGSTGSSDKIDSTSLAFGTSSPLAMFTTGAADVVDSIEVVVDTTFTGGTPSLSIGVSGTASKYMSATDIDLTAAAGTVFVVHPGLGAQGAESLIATYAANSASAGAARILVHYATPS
jgi:hypothetical protein